MPRNNSLSRKLQRKGNLELRLIEINESGKSVAEREAERGYPRKLNAQKAATSQ